MARTIRFLATAAAMAGILCVGGAGRARADESNRTAPQADQEGYRVEMAVASASSIGLFLLGDALESQGSPIPDAMMAVGAISAPLVGPVIHVRHHRYARALASFGMRVGLPITLGIIGARSAHCGPDSIACGLDQLGLGMLIGSVLASALDTTLLSGPASPGGAGDGGPESAEARPARRATTAATGLAPTVGASSSLAFVGLAGRF